MKELEQPLISIIVPVYKVEKYLKTEADNGVHRERDHDGAVHQYGYMDILRESRQ